MPGIEARFTHSGHILGAGLIECRIGGRLVVFSGDLGRYGVPIMRDPDPVAAADVLLVESTYGDRLHTPDDHAEKLAEAARRAVDTKGWLLIPAFAVGRSQEILYDLRDAGGGAAAPVVAGLPRQSHGHPGDGDLRVHPEEHDRDLQEAEVGGKRPFATRRIAICRSVEDSKRLNDTAGPGIIIAGSGMATGGRILHHLRRLLPEEATTVLFVGYQAAGTRGRLLRDGAQTIKMLGEIVPVRARIMVSDAYSAHADRGEILRWLRGFTGPPTMTYIVHGEPPAAAALRDAIARDLRWPVTVAEDGQRVTL